MAQQQSVLITGASSGFGRATAERFADAGWRVYAGVRDPQGRHAEATRALEARGIRAVDLDVTDQASVDRAASEILAAGAPDVLVNNAGSVFFGVVEAFTPEAAQRQFDVNVFGALRVNRAFLPAMRERRSGLIVFVSSVVGRLIFPFTGVYTASKWALEAFAETTSYELAPLGIDVAIVQPGAYPTNITASSTSADDDARLAGYGDVTPFMANIFEALEQSSQGRSPQEVAEAVFALAQRPAGQRPLRTPVPSDPGTEQINAGAAAVQRELLDALGLGALQHAQAAAR